MSVIGSTLLGAAGSLRDLIAQRKLEALQADALARRQAQQEFENTIETRKVGVQEREAEIAAKRPGPRQPGHVVRGVLSNGKLVTRLIGDDGSVIAEMDQQPDAADTQVEQVVGPDGKPVIVTRKDAVGKRPYIKPNAPPQGFIVQTGSGPMIADRGAGTAKPLLGPNGQPLSAPLSAGQQSQLDEMEATTGATADIRTGFKPEYVGPLGGRAYKTQEATGLNVGGGVLAPKLSKEQSDFYASVASLKNQVIREITGAAVGVQEEGRILAEVPDVTQPPDVFMARLGQTEKNRARLRNILNARRTRGTGDVADPGAPIKIERGAGGLRRAGAPPPAGGALRIRRGPEGRLIRE